MIQAKEIWKYVLDLNDWQEIAMPYGAEIISAAAQGSSLCLWAIVSPKNEMLPRRIRIVGTGQLFDDSQLRHINSVLMQPFVWHVFEA